MALHPAPPTDVRGLIDAWRHTVQAVIDLGHSCHQADFERPTACPGWTVKDQISHIVGTELWVGTGEVPQVQVPRYGHVRHEMGAFLEKAVEVRRARVGEVVVAELAQVFAMRITQYDRPGLSLDSPQLSPLGNRTLREVLTNRIMDVWCHEQDIRAALNRPGHLDSGAAAVFMSELWGKVPDLLVHADIPDEHAVIFDSTGPVAGRVGARIVHDEHGSPSAVPLFSGHGHTVHAGEHTTTITLTTEAMTRRAAGRGDTDSIHYTVHGDPAIARRAMDALSFTP